MSQSGVAGRGARGGSTPHQRLLSAIVSGEYAAGVRLPAERQLAQTLNTSRPMLREALRELEAGGLVAVRRGSGALVQPATRWRFAVLPAYFSNGAPLTQGGVAKLIGELLELRTHIVTGVFALCAANLQPGALNPARAAAARAWEQRTSLEAFVRCDLDALRAVAEAAGVWSALWLMNTMADVYERLGRVLDGTYAVTEDYLPTYMEVFAALERGESDEACTAMRNYYDRNYRQFMAAAERDPE